MWIWHRRWNNSIPSLEFTSFLWIQEIAVSSPEIRRYKSHACCNGKGLFSLWITFQWDTFMRLEKEQLEIVCVFLWLVYSFDLHDPLWVIEATFLTSKGLWRAATVKIKLTVQKCADWGTLCQLIFLGFIVGFKHKQCSPKNLIMNIPVVKVNQIIVYW